MDFRLSAGLAALAALFTLVGCSGGGSGSVETDPEVYFINGVSDSGPLEFRMDDEVAEASLAFKAFSTDFQEFEFKDDDPDGYDLSVHDASSGLELSRDAFPFAQDTDTVIIAHGLRNFGTEDLKRLRVARLVVNRRIVNGNRTRLIVFHGMEREVGTFTPGIIFKNPGNNPQFTTPTIESGNSSVIEVDSGNQDWEVKRFDTEGVFATASSNLQAGATYLVLIAGLEGAASPDQQPSVTFVRLAEVF